MQQLIFFKIWELNENVTWKDTQLSYLLINII